MNRPRPSTCWAVTSVPRGSGDEPVGLCQAASNFTCSPRGAGMNRDMDTSNHASGHQVKHDWLTESMVSGARDVSGMSSPGFDKNTAQGRSSRPARSTARAQSVASSPLRAARYSASECWRQLALRLFARRARRPARRRRRRDRSRGPGGSGMRRGAAPALPDQGSPVR